MAAYPITAITIPLPLNTPSYAAGEVIDDGEAVYLDSATSQVMLAFSNGTAAQSRAIGFACNSATLGQSVSVNSTQTMTVNGSLAVSTLYFLSSTPGAIELESDIPTGGTAYKTLLAVASDATTLVPNLWATEVLKP